METPHVIDLTNPAHAYFFGFIQGDGHLYRQKDNPNKGKLEIELNVRDEDILHRFHAMFPEGSLTYRHRSTNFSEAYDSITWRMCRQGFREQIEALGVPAGKKSLTVSPPTVPFSAPDYWRGFFDADGSLGFTAVGIPYLSLVTTSEDMAVAYERFLHGLTGKTKVLNRNVRDRAYNIVVFCEDAVKVANVLYSEGCLALERKRKKATEIMAWTRPATMRVVVSSKAWTTDEDQIVRSHSVAKAATLLGRSESSVANRRFRLRSRPIPHPSDSSI